MFALSTESAYAQDAKPAAQEQAPDTVVVTGIRRGIEAAISLKKNSTSIVRSDFCGRCR